MEFFEYDVYGVLQLCVVIGVVGVDEMVLFDLDIVVVGFSLGICGVWLMIQQKVVVEVFCEVYDVFVIFDVVEQVCC